MNQDWTFKPNSTDMVRYDSVLILLKWENLDYAVAIIFSVQSCRHSSRVFVFFADAISLCLHRYIISRRSIIKPYLMEEGEAVPKPVVVDPPLFDEAPPPASQRRPVVVAADAAPPEENNLIQRIQRALVELRELRNQFNDILRELQYEVGEEEQAESSVEDPEDSDS